MTKPLSRNHGASASGQPKGTLLLLSTCGTSIFTNQASPEDRGWLTRSTNARNLSSEDAQRFDAISSRCRSQLLQAGHPEKCRISAELNSISAVLKRWPAQRIQHILVHSDTEIGERATTLLQEVLEADSHLVQRVTAGGLRTDDSSSLRHALAEISREILEWTTADKGSGNHVIFNLTGGFKSVNAYLQAIGTLYADRCVFLFESSQQLMEIPRLPMRLDEQDEIRKNLTAFRKLHIGYLVSPQDFSGNVDSLLITIDDEVATSPWGDAAWAQARLPLMGSEILDPLSPRLKISV